MFSLILILSVKCFGVWKNTGEVRVIVRLFDGVSITESVYTVALFAPIGTEKLAHEVNLLFKFVIRTHSAITWAYRCNNVRNLYEIQYSYDKRTPSLQTTRTPFEVLYVKVQQTSLRRQTPVDDHRITTAVTH
jgi:hypothetical protein